MYQTHSQDLDGSRKSQRPGPLLTLSLAVKGNHSEKTQQSLLPSGPENFLHAHVNQVGRSFAPQWPNPHLTTTLDKTEFLHLLSMDGEE